MFHIFFLKGGGALLLLHSATRGRVRCFGLTLGELRGLLAAGGTRGAAIV